MKFAKHSGVYTLEVEQFLPIGVEEAWLFLSNPKNLEKISPSHMGFQITSNVDSKMYPGQIITYAIGIFAGIKTNWVTEITHVNEPVYFVDEQRFGPYSMWHHEHRIIKKDNGVLMMDKVTYKVPMGILGNIAHAVFIKKQLRKIFTYRFDVLNVLFPNKSVEKS